MNKSIDSFINYLAYGDPSRVVDLDNPKPDPLSGAELPPDFKTLSATLGMMVTAKKYHSVGAMIATIAKLLEADPGLIANWAMLLYSAARTAEEAEQVIYHLTEHIKDPEVIKTLVGNIAGRVVTKRVMCWKPNREDWSNVALLDHPAFQYLSGKGENMDSKAVDGALNSQSIADFLTACKRGRIRLRDLQMYRDRPEYWGEVILQQDIEYVLENIPYLAREGFINRGTELSELMVKEFANRAKVKTCDIDVFTIMATARRYFAGANPQSKTPWEMNPKVVAALTHLHTLLQYIESKPFLGEGDVDVYIDGSQSAKIRWAYHMSCLESMAIQGLVIAQNCPNVKFWQVGNYVEPLEINPNDSLTSVLNRFTMKTDNFNHQAVQDKIKSREADAIVMSDHQFYNGTVKGYSDIAYGEEKRIVLCNTENEALKVENLPADYCWVVKGRGKELNSFLRVVMS